MPGPGTFVWNELLSSDPAAAMAFYAETLGWTFEPFGLGTAPYWVARAGDAMVAGIGGLDAGDIETPESYWLATIEVTDIDERFAVALEHGATAIRPPHDVPGIGRVALLRDPTGAAICWLTPPSS